MRKGIALLKKAGNIIIEVGFWGSVCLIVYVCLLIFLFASFKIPTDSMTPTLVPGDFVLVNKAITGARVFNIFASLREEETPIYRLPGLKKVEADDVIIFNFPYPNSMDSLQMHIMKYYAKRCIGVPGDSLVIRNGFYGLAGKEERKIGFLPGQERLSRHLAEVMKEGDLHYSFPYDSVAGWNIRDFGALYIPAKGDYISMTPFHFLLYRKLIEWEQKASLQLAPDGSVTLGGKALPFYRFCHNYYFAGGDHAIDSRDSRYWGLLPEEFIVGKVWRIWKSVDPLTGKMRWERVLTAP
ncbi:MAG: signal peptidase I [Tannerellaceae bacterium]|jgi:signal peptidase I|nr:signal peptidase I [Tannerellaceae bacterium]